MSRGRKRKRRRRKTLQELIFKDNFLFAAVMLDEENARGVLERSLSIEIDYIEISYEKSIIYNPEYKGIRLDVHAKDAHGTHFTVEMQVVSKKILKRARYYHDQIDMELLLSGEEYETMPDSYVIFICDFDPFGLGKYKYTRQQNFVEAPDYDYEDGSHTVFLSTKGKNPDEVSKDLVSFLHFVGADLTESQKEFEDEFVKRLQKSINQIKQDREMGRRYMLMEELMKDEFKAGLAEGESRGHKAGKAEGLYLSIITILESKAPIPEHLKQRIASIRDADALDAVLKQAVKAATAADFELALDEMRL